MHLWVAGSMGVLLRHTAMGEVYVLASLVAVLVLAAAGARWVTKAPTLWRLVAVLSGGLVLGLVAGLAVAPKVMRELSREGHIFEWLTAEMLLVASILGTVLAVRLARAGRPSPLAVFFAAGYFAGFWRELEWGEPFFGEKIWYSRFLFRPRAYVDASRFAGQARSVGLSAEYLHTVHLIFASLVLLLVAAVVLYLVRRRELFRQELRALPRTASGRFFLLGVGIYVGVQGAGAIFRAILATRWLAEWSRVNAISHDAVVEPLEVLAALSFLASMVALWRERAIPAPAGAVVGPPAAGRVGRARLAPAEKPDG